MSSVISSISPSRSIYEVGEHNKVVSELLFASNDKKKLDFKLGNETVKEHLNALFELSKKNSQESIELLQNLALGNGEIASYSQDLLCKLLMVRDGVTHEIANTVRAGCQKLITDFSSSVTTQEVIDSHPKLLLLASTKIHDQTFDDIPNTVKESVKKFDAYNEKPQWWRDNKPNNGVFDADSLLSIVDASEPQRRKVQVTSDGMCFFRAILTDTNHDVKYADKEKVSTEDIINNIKANYESQLDASIDEALTKFKPEPLRQYSHNEIKSALKENLHLIWSGEGIAQIFDVIVNENIDDFDALSDVIFNEFHNVFDTTNLVKEGHHYNVFI
ncbi:hypothetical protein EJ063_07560 [Vibrio aquaticus]|uniref:OTU domain-containing protein n=1 Tax=Vibrio aquaticus TaxID=2496559 RepID=A0A432CXQ9_9VIBR|nr:hypothetical protein [Vibrio aquaticus]RTZ16643.1 hypothetical protein EJ063_07560 [Vibrio aquaticus]